MVFERFTQKNIVRIYPKGSGCIIITRITPDQSRLTYIWPWNKNDNMFLAFQTAQHIPHSSALNDYGSTHMSRSIMVRKLPLLIWSRMSRLMNFRMNMRKASHNQGAQKKFAGGNFLTVINKRIDEVAYKTTCEIFYSSCWHESRNSETERKRVMQCLDSWSCNWDPSTFKTDSCSW